MFCLLERQIQMRKFINFSLKSEKCVKTWMYPLEAQEIRRVNSMAIILLIQRLKSTIERQSSFHILKCCTVNCPLYLNTPSARVPKVAISGAKVPQCCPILRRRSDRICQHSESKIWTNGRRNGHWHLWTIVLGMRFMLWIPVLTDISQTLRFYCKYLQHCR